MNFPVIPARMALINVDMAILAPIRLRWPYGWVARSAVSAPISPPFPSV